ncbi:MAG: hypothetical protein HQL56_08070 [Magnetococcales bacterium]|nr:hypothetical protein [Magnetococcales bacterium]
MNFLLARLKEPTTWISLGLAAKELMGGGYGQGAEEILKYLVLIGMLLGAIMKERAS